MVNRPIDWTRQLTSEAFLPESVKDELEDIRSRGGSALVVGDFANFLFDDDARAIKLLKCGLLPPEEFPFRQATISLAAAIVMMGSRRDILRRGLERDLERDLRRAEIVFLFSWLPLDQDQLAVLIAEGLSQHAQDMIAQQQRNPSFGVPRFIDELPQSKWAKERWWSGEAALKAWRDNDPSQFPMVLFDTYR